MPKTPFQFAAEFMLPPRKSRISFGNTGAINPSANMSSMTVTKMNAMAAGRFFISKWSINATLWPRLCQPPKQYEGAWHKRLYN